MCAYVVGLKVSHYEVPGFSLIAQKLYYSTREEVKRIRNHLFFFYLFKEVAIYLTAQSWMFLWFPWIRNSFFLAVFNFGHCGETGQPLVLLLVSEQRCEPLSPRCLLSGCTSHAKACWCRGYWPQTWVKCLCWPQMS